MTDLVKCDKFFKIPYMIWIIGISGMLVNLSSIMVFSLTPIYLTQVFGMTTFHLGILEGIVEFISWGIRIFAGFISDYFKKRKPLLVGAYTLTIFARPILALAPSITWVYCAKILDRISNGLQATPREALVGDIAPKESKGACYGLRQSLGFAGSILGALCIMVLMPWMNNNFSYIFWIAAIPSVLALLALLFFVKDIASVNPLQTKSKRKPISALFKEIMTLDPAFWLLLLVAGIFMISNYSGAYRILQANNVGMPLESVSIVMLVQNIGALAGFPMGRLSDKYDRKILLAIGFAITILANLCFGLINSVTGVILGATLWGVQMGVTQSIFQAMIADTVHPDLRGTSFGIYYLVTACALFVANAVMGFVFESYGYTMAFMFSAVMAFIGLLSIVVLKKPSKQLSVV
ncbi:MAG: MFS transporter [Parachlamydiaceae bacterium]|nr:MFS transporter [Parachlamydiaceae bacterium]